MYSQMIAQHFRQLNVYGFHLSFIKTDHELNCCVFISRECKYHFVLSIPNLNFKFDTALDDSIQYLTQQ